MTLDTGESLAFIWPTEVNVHGQAMLGQHSASSKQEVMLLCCAMGFLGASSVVSHSLFSQQGLKILLTSFHCILIASPVELLLRKRKPWTKRIFQTNSWKLE